MTDSEKKYLDEKCKELGCERKCDWCKHEKCIREKIRHKIYYQKNREKQLAMVKKWKEENHEKAKEYSRKSHEKHKFDDRSEYYRNYYLKKKEEQIKKNNFVKTFLPTIERIACKIYAVFCIALVEQYDFSPEQAEEICEFSRAIWMQSVEKNIDLSEWCKESTGIDMKTRVHKKGGE